MSFLSACTIASNNYLAFARVLVESYREHHPGAEVYVCVVDEPHPEVPYARLPFTPIFARELGIPNWDSFAFRHSILELNTAVKPYLLTRLRDRFGLDRVLYFDPDILIRDRLTGIETALEKHAAVLTPHITRPLDNDRRPPERVIRITGVYNLGFLGLRLDARTADFLEWWKERLYRFCRVDLQHGLFVDQSWMDFAPSFLDSVAILRQPIYNVAYWNLQHRDVRVSGERWLADGEPIGFFHFSGIDLDDLEVVSRHQDRIRLEERPELKPCFEHYRSRVLDAGHRRLESVPYAYGRFRDTTIEIPAVARTMLARVDPQARRWPDPFEVRARDSYYNWLLEPIELEGGVLNRAALAAWEQRPDLSRTFRHVCDEDLPGYVEWLTRDADGRRAGLDATFRAGVRLRRDADRARPPDAARRLTPFDPSVLDSSRSLLEWIDLTRPRQLAAWLNEPVPGRARVRPLLTHLTLMLHHVRSDLQTAFPDPLDGDQVGFALWFVNHAAREYRLHPDLVRPVRRSLPAGLRLRNVLTTLKARVQGERRAGPVPPSVEAAPEVEVAAPGAAAAGPGGLTAARGVNLAGYFDAHTGVGQMGRASALALERAGFPVARAALDRDPQGLVVGGRIHHPEGTPFQVTLINANADETRRALRTLPLAATQRSHKIGYWYWELSHFPLEFADRFGLLDEVWAPSRFCQRAYEAAASCPVRYVPPHAPPPRAAGANRGEFSLDPERFYFLYALDVLSVPERKNPSAAIEALRRLHADGRRQAALVLKVYRAAQAPELMERLRREADDLPVVFLTRTLTRAAMDRLLACCDAVLSPHRSEGLGLLPIEALWLEKPVIATAYGGVTDFLDETTGYPLEFELRHLDRAYGPYPEGAVWAEPGVRHAASCMRRVLDHPDEARDRARQGRRRVEQIYGLDAAGRRFAQELERIFARLDGAAAAAEVAAAPLRREAAATVPGSRRAG